ncbi:transcription elongation factor GreA [Candidatus Woesebacteria bacterium RIFCSPHIGHO2_01_FULL_44_21]|uniref:Transcription elongation factor GreA n=1 Tax=Candidatus Woesebacteria bacterium RIFCSPHIGHO2_01_FULL_44_21 TaxID=1802503 RepID=A0A1F7Z1Z3_9BACT|nr:MAG: transcription elongation factor GreA [Candidatus Woesebacteria bacterium RIFCSPHIGHO2_01_FULL_44_21]OGM69441.1 MAG: transcription elongation factor GreA [Candidatus Woesebacteria bacterium RIFCSPLOWO2_01_FULL_44_24b]
MDTQKQVQVTKSGLEALKVELDELVGVKRPKLVERLERARQEGDLSENSDYINAREELEFLDGRIDELKNVVENADVVADNGNGNGKVGIGTTVIVQANGDRHEFNIVGEWEADPAQKKISHESPLGKQLVGKKVGETIEVEAPAGKLIYKILEIKKPSS